MNGHVDKSKRAHEAIENVDLVTKRVKIDRKRANKDRHSLLDSIDEQNFMEFTGENDNNENKENQQPLSILQNTSPTNLTNETCTLDSNRHSLLWDSYNLKSHPEIESGKENTPLQMTEFHLCYKDEKITKVSISFDSQNINK